MSKSKSSIRITNLIKLPDESQEEAEDMGRPIENFLEFDDEEDRQEWLKELEQEKQQKTQQESNTGSSIKDQIQRKRKTKSLMNNDSNADISQRIVKMSRVERDIERIVDPKIGLPYLPTLFEEEFNSKHNFDATATSLELSSTESLSIRLKHLLKLYSRWYKTILPQYSVAEAAEVVEEASRTKRVLAVRQEQREKFYGFHKAAYSTQKHKTSNYVAQDSKMNEQIIGKITDVDEAEFDFAKEHENTNTRRRVAEDDEEEEFQFIAQDSQNEMPPPPSKKKAKALKKKKQIIQEEEEEEPTLDKVDDDAASPVKKKPMDEGEEEFQFDTEAPPPTTTQESSMEIPLPTSNTLSFSLEDNDDDMSQDAVVETTRSRLKRKRN